jgi:hypothetical protein
MIGPSVTTAVEFHRTRDIRTNEAESKRMGTRPNSMESQEAIKPRRLAGLHHHVIIVCQILVRLQVLASQLKPT